MPVPPSPGPYSAASADGALPGLLGRRGVMAAGTGIAGLLLGGSFDRPAAAAPATGSRTPVAVNVMDYGAVGDGVTDDTAAARTAIDDAEGDLVFFPAGTYLLDRLSILDKADLMLGVGATLRHKPGSGDAYMIGFAGNFLRIRGGVLDGNKEEQSGRPTLIGGSVQTGKEIVLEGVQIRNSVKAAVYANDFGGHISIQDCTIRDQAEHDGVAGHWTAIVALVSGQPGERGHVRFNHNRAVGTTRPSFVGGQPGGLFLGPVTDANAGQGSLVTLEAIGNYFWGYGQLCQGNYIAPIHSYPSLLGARVVANYFEQSATSAIAAKCVEDFICIGNVVVDGQVHDAASPAAGAISYAPADRAADTQYPRAVISDNIIMNPGGTSGRVRNGISATGSATSLAAQVIVSNNVVDGCGVGITAEHAKDVVISQNILTSLDPEQVSSHYAGMRLDYILGDISVTGNKLTNRNRHGIVLAYGVAQAKVTITGNFVRHDDLGYYGLYIGGADTLIITNNTFDGEAYSVTVRGSSSTPVKKMYFYDTNAFVNDRTVIFRFDGILACYGDIPYVNSPVGVVTPGEVGTRYTARNGKPGAIRWISTGTTSSDWVAVG